MRDGDERSYTGDIEALCDVVLKGSAVTSLECAAASTQAFAFLLAPDDTHLLSRCPHSPLAVLGTMELLTSTCSTSMRSLPASKRQKSPT